MALCTPALILVGYNGCMYGYKKEGQKSDMALCTPALILVGYKGCMYGYKKNIK
jgi:hypothetical protein